MKNTKQHIRYHSNHIFNLNPKSPNRNLDQAQALLPEIKPFVKVQRVSPDKRRVVPRIRPRNIPKIRHIEKPGSAASGEEDLLLVGLISFS